MPDPGVWFAAVIAESEAWPVENVRSRHSFGDHRYGTESDLIVSDRRTGELAGVEVKLTATPTQRHARTLAGLAERFGSRFTVGLVVHSGRHTLPLGERLWAVPVSALWRDDPLPGFAG